MLFTFQGAQGNVITVQATRSGGSGTFDPVIEVFSPSGLRLRRAGGGFSYVARIDTLTLPQDGLFTILIKDDDGADIATYGLGLEKVNPGVGPQINYGTILRDSITAPADMDTYTFQGAQGNVITVQATRSGGSGTFDPVIEVFSPSGLRLRRAGGGFSYVARIDTLTLPQDGLFTILIKDDDGADIATYDLSLNCLTCSPLLATWLHGPLLPSKTAKSLS